MNNPHKRTLAVLRHPCRVLPDVTYVAAILCDAPRTLTPTWISAASPCALACDLSSAPFLDNTAPLSVFLFLVARPASTTPFITSAAPLWISKPNFAFNRSADGKNLPLSRLSLVANPAIAVEASWLFEEVEGGRASSRARRGSPSCNATGRVRRSFAAARTSCQLPVHMMADTPVLPHG